jgi:uncharacterized protein YdiU (UPF0061 family)
VRAARRRLQRQAPAIDVAAADALAVSTATLPGAPPSWRLGRAASAARRAIAATVSAMTAPLVSLAAMPWDDDFVRSLPGDHSGNPASRQLHGVAYALAAPTAVAAPRLLAWADEVGALLGVARPVDDADPTVAMLAGNLVAPGARPYAACYGGHQFGQWAGQLGDGRALTLGELVGPDGARWEVQLKGAGPTPLSRRGDGRAVLRSSVREFLCSEAMHHLGVPTTRALALVVTGDAVVRDMFYDGRPRAEPGAIVTRVAPSFLRLGSFELPTSRDDHGLLARLADHAITRHAPELANTPAPTRYALWFHQVCARTAVMIAHWMRVGFVHGVMNTDNLSILGLTLDYGPYGWLDTFDPDFTPNTTDAERGRYRFGMQPGIGRWNLAHFGRALRPLVQDDDALAAGLELYRDTFDATFRRMQRGKLGLGDDGGAAPARRAEDDALVAELHQLLAAHDTDPTRWYRRLGALAEAPALPAAAQLLAAVDDTFYRPPGPDHARVVAGWLARWWRRLAEEPGPASARRAAMDAINPAFILRNYLVHEAIGRAETGDHGGIDELLAAARAPYREDPDPGRVHLYARRPDWARDAAGCSALSCSS